MSPLTGVINDSWQLYKAHARHLLTIAFLVYLIAAIVSGLVQLVGGYFGLLLGVLVTLAAVFVVQATLVKAVQDVRDGREDLSVGETFSAAAPFLRSVAGASILASILVTVGLNILIIPGVILITIWCLIIPVIVLEGVGALESFRRSQQLVRDNFWNVLGTLVLVFITLYAVYAVLGLILGVLPVFASAFLSTLIAGTLVSPFIALVVTESYFRLSAVTAGGPAPAGGPYTASAGAPYGTGWPAGGQADTGFPPAAGQQDANVPPPGGEADRGWFTPRGQSDTGLPPTR
jgi:hypothetical protein